jgi:glutathione synthase/RimK-type ligase-like ATP-grasp enzyme
MVMSMGLEGGEADVLEGQWRALLLGLESVPGPRWVSSPAAIRRAEDKALQLALARKLGLNVPATLWTNALPRAREFFAQRDDAAVAKSVSSAWWEREDSGWFVFASALQASDLPEEPALAGAPVSFQQPIEPKRDLRVNVVGERAFAAIRGEEEGDFQGQCEYLDWRQGTDVQWASCELPEELVKACVELVRELDLQFGAIDLLLDADGKYWFLEINPNGEWGWLQRSGLPIAEALADRLLGA